MERVLGENGELLELGGESDSAGTRRRRELPRVFSSNPEASASKLGMEFRPKVITIASSISLFISHHGIYGLSRTAAI